MGKQCEMIKIGHSKSFWTTLVGKDGKKCRITKIEHVLNHIHTTLVGKRSEKVQNEQNCAFQIILNHFDGKQLEKELNEQN